MARPRKETIDYFPHTCKHGKTMFVLEERFGNNGYAFWFKLLEILGSSNGHYFDCSDLANWQFLLSKTRTTTESASEMLDLLSTLCAIDGEMWQHRIIWVQNFVDNIEDAYSKRVDKLPKRPVFLLNKEFPPPKSQENNQPGNTNTESKNKEEEIKGYKNDIPKKHLFSESDFFDIEKFEAAFTGSHYEHANLKIYHEEIKNWSAANGNKKVDWIAFARNWMMKEFKNNTLLLKDQKRIANGNNYKIAGAQSASNAQQLIRHAIDEDRAANAASSNDT